jgi:hypothetical protein
MNMFKSRKFLLFLDILKIVALIICIVAFGWKVFDSYMTFRAKGTGTNIEIHPITKVGYIDTVSISNYVE